MPQMFLRPDPLKNTGDWANQNLVRGREHRKISLDSKESGGLYPKKSLKLVQSNLWVVSEDDFGWSVIKEFSHHWKKKIKKLIAIWFILKFKVNRSTFWKVIKVLLYLIYILDTPYVKYLVMSVVMDFTYLQFDIFFVIWSTRNALEKASVIGT